MKRLNCIVVFDRHKEAHIIAAALEFPIDEMTQGQDKMEPSALSIGIDG